MSDDGNFYEDWTRDNDSVFTAYSHMTISGDTVFSESVKLAINGKFSVQEFPMKRISGMHPVK